ncbi:serine/threonine protein kinase [Kovacikia minuta CCNUW1]|uniref:serine/threonine protein kinase n=1 Tax=Kovacikia minuta TaxID=2931930 RepID=UPI001CCF0D5B|nr:serine/threonine-protein kinase [Kovacikia minuta]UBF25720.1 serine/threonine protein kinase [Kovacikia minuta CCNUW1]
MVFSIPVGTVLRQRYIIQQVLGQGGFGRTYLALDQERFNEPCVLKEFVVPYQDGTLVEKSKTLFQREASTLYQIQHPQIPRFWASFEDEQRLFLVQDFVNGETYRKLLNDRKQEGQAFSEPEVLYFLNHLLPVLAYIHERDIVHRDITPENIILRTPDTTQFGTTTLDSETGLPVLIDFGAVKEATSHWPLMSTATRVGKVGYAPPEQLQTGKVYPNSDLYALAATSLTLLTGKEPQSLLDSQTLTWRWQPYATISDDLGRILQKMLSIYPGDRFQSASEVLAALEPLLENSAKSALIPPTAAKPGARKAATRTQGNPLLQFPGSYAASSPEGSPSFPINDRPGKPFGKLNSRVGIGIAATVLVGLGVATPIWWQSRIGNTDSNGEVWVSGTKLPQSEASRIIESQGLSSSSSALKVPASADTSSAKTSQPPQRIQFSPGKISTVVKGSLQSNELQPYVLEGTQGQIMTATLDGAGATMNLLRSNQEAVDSAAYQTHSWTGQLPADDQYLIQVSGSGSYSLDVAITPASRPTEEETQRVTFAKGTTGTTVTGEIAPNQVRRYLLKSKQGQILSLKVLQGKVNLSAIAPNGLRIGGSATNSKNWQGRVPMNGDYVIELTTQQAGDYVLSLEVF